MTIEGEIPLEPGTLLGEKYRLGAPIGEGAVALFVLLRLKLDWTAMRCAGILRSETPYRGGFDHA